VTIAAGLIASRFLHYLAVSVLFGAALFPVYAIGLPSATDASMRWLPRLLMYMALLALISGVLWLIFTAAGMSGTLAGAFDRANLSVVVSQTDFGRVWVARLGLAALLTLLLLLKPTRVRIYVVLFGSLILLASIALTGHAGSGEGSAGLVHRIADAFHLVAGGVWVGALVVLARAVVVAVRQIRDDDLRILHHALARFSGIGPIVVATLFLTGIINPGFLSSLKSAYGQVLLAKLAIFGAMLLLAAANRFWLTARLTSALESKSGSEEPVRALRASVLTETALALLVLAAVGWLGTLSPPE
jgi:copper resistance protein D